MTGITEEYFIFLNSSATIINSTQGYVTTTYSNLTTVLSGTASLNLIVRHVGIGRFL
jgi:hypothetical protein